MITAAIVENTQYWKGTTMSRIANGTAIKSRRSTV
jgi:hypothetical protein